MPLARVRRHASLFLVRTQEFGLPGLCLAALLAAFAVVNLAVALAFPPADRARCRFRHIIPRAVSDRLTAKLASLEAKSGIQLVVATVKSLQATTT